MFRYSVRNYDQIISEFGTELNGFLPVVRFNLTERAHPLPPSEEGGVKQFEKGYDRLKSWLSLAGLNPNPSYRDLPFFWSPLTNEMIPIKVFQTVDKFQRDFCLAALIICFQVFGDGNHRAANYFFKARTGRNLTDKERNIIEELYRSFDYGYLIEERRNYAGFVTSMLEDLVRVLVKRINELGATASASRGGRKLKTKRNSKSKSKNIRKKTYKVKRLGSSHKYKYSRRK